MTVINYADLDGETRGTSERFPAPVRMAGEIPRESVTGEVGGLANGVAQFGDGTNDVFYLRATVNAQDDIQCGSRLANGYPDVVMLNPGDSIVISSNVAITRLDVVAIGDATSGTLAARELVTRAETEANFLLAKNTWVFDSTDDVREVVLMATERYSASTAGAPVGTANYVDLFVVGRSHA